MAEVIISETGPQGPPGMNWKGNYDSTVAYNITDGVFYSGSSYICLIPNVNTAPTGNINDPNWGFLCAGGAGGGLTFPQILGITVLGL